MTTEFELLEFIALHGDSLQVFTRNELRAKITELFGEQSITMLNILFKHTYIRRCAMHGYDLNREGLQRYFQLKDTKRTSK